MTGILHEDQYTCLIIPSSVLPRMRIVSDRNFGANQVTHFMFNNVFQKIVPFMR